MLQGAPSSSCYDKNTIYVIGNAKAAQNNPITLYYNNRFFIALVIDLDSGLIVDASASVMLPITVGFMRSLFIGYSMNQGLNEMIAEITRRYHGSSQSGLVVAWRDAYKKYEQIIKIEKQ